MTSTAASRNSQLGHAVRHVCELAVGVVIVSLVLRTWVVEGLIVPVTIAGSSMAPTLRGPHYEAKCPNCHFALVCDAEVLPPPIRMRCPHCGLAVQIPVQALPKRGQRVLVDRTPLAPLQRWDVVVFRATQRGQDYWVKRVVGLPGESIQIRHGDVYVDGQIARKSLADVRKVAQLVFDSAFLPQQRADEASRWEPRADRSAWQAEGNAFTLPAAPQTPTHQIDWLVYHHALDQPVRDDVQYNVGESRLLSDVSDLMLSCLVEAEGAGELVLRMHDTWQWFEVAIPLERGDIRLHCDGRLLGTAPASCTLGARPVRVELALCDRQVLVALDGREQLVIPYEAPDRPAGPTCEPVRIGARSAGLHLRELRVLRDIYYTEPQNGLAAHGIERPTKLAAGELFVLGDNSPVSDDSRTIPGGAVPDKLLIGKVLGHH